MPIWVDADACPRPIKDILLRAAERTGVELYLVANHALSVPRRHNVRLLQVPGGFDVADKAIMDRVAAGDLVITAAQHARLHGHAARERGTDRGAATAQPGRPTGLRGAP
jgi:uncharacterized protein YaiI (UPF0178 family)